MESQKATDNSYSRKMIKNPALVAAAENMIEDIWSDDAWGLTEDVKAVVNRKKIVDQEKSSTSGIKRKRDDEDEDFPSSQKLKSSQPVICEIGERDKEEKLNPVSQVSPFYVVPIRFSGFSGQHQKVLYFPCIRIGDRVYVHPYLQQGDDPTEEEYTHGMATWRVFGNLVCGLNLSTWRLTVFCGIHFPNERNQPYDTIVVLNRLLKMWDFRRFPRIRERRHLENAVSLVISIRLSGGHLDNAALMRDPAKYLSAIMFLSGPLCVNDTVTFNEVVKVMKVAELVVVRPENLPSR